MAKAMAGEELDARERFEISMLNRARLRGYENFIYQRNLKLFDESEWNGVLASIKGSMASTPYIQEDWKAVREGYSESLRKVIDPILDAGVPGSKAHGTSSAQNEAYRCVPCQICARKRPDSLIHTSGAKRNSLKW